MKDVVAKPLRILLGRGSAALVSVLFVGYIARELPKSTLALVALHQMVTLASKILLELGLSYAVLKEASPFYARGDHEGAMRAIGGNVTTTRLLATLAFAFVYGLAGLAASRWLGPVFPGMDVAIAAPFAALHLFAKNAQAACAPLFQAQERFATESTLDSASALAEKIPAVVFYLVFGMDTFFAGLALGQIVITLLCVFLLRASLRHLRVTQLDRALVREKLVTYRPHYLRQVYRQGARQADQLLVALLLPIEHTATLHVARNASSYLQHVSRAFTDPFTMHLARPESARDRDRNLRATLAFTAGVPLLVTLVSPWAMQIFGGPRYADAWPVLAVLCASYVFYGLAQTELAILTMLGSGADNLHMDLVAALIGLGVTALACTLIGPNGMGLGQLVTFFVTYVAARPHARSLWKQEHARIAEREAEAS